ncbi:hypothetical protein DTO063F5_8818 [Paecilomyces variotii]|nr:hypothetical protein DTO063F5_8818 [Paecilomyces variotii]KAJ9411255.1 hypothetical protein DTO045G8_887 [Paecilomyces variotii]
MRFTSSASVALVASLAALGEASYPFHARSGKFLHHARGFNSTADDGVSSVFVIPTPAEKTPQVTPSIPLSTGAAREIDPEAAVSTQTSVEDLTLTYTLGGASTTVVTTTVQRTATNTVVVTQTPEASVTQEAVADDEPTTTISTTSTTTSIVTVYPVASSALVGGSNAAGSCNGATVTVTEKETVTVTAGATATDAASSNSIANAVNEADITSAVQKQVAEPTAVPSSPAVSAPAVPAVPAVPAGPPYGNGTFPTFRKASTPSGFLTSKLPLPSNFARRM